MPTQIHLSYDPWRGGFHLKFSDARTESARQLLNKTISLYFDDKGRLVSIESFVDGRGGLQLNGLRDPDDAPPRRRKLGEADSVWRWDVAQPHHGISGCHRPSRRSSTGTGRGPARLLLDQDLNWAAQSEFGISVPNAGRRTEYYNVLPTAGISSREPSCRWYPTEYPRADLEVFAELLEPLARDRPIQPPIRQVGTLASNRHWATQLRLVSF